MVMTEISRLFKWTQDQILQLQLQFLVVITLKTLQDTLQAINHEVNFYYAHCSVSPPYRLLY